MTFFGGGPLGLFTLLRLAFESDLELESSLSALLLRVVAGDVSFSSLDFLEPRFGLGDAFGDLVVEDLLSDSDSELLSGEKILFFFNAPVSGFGGAFCIVFGIGFGVFAPDGILCAVLPLARTAAADFGFADIRLLGGAGLGLVGFGVSSSLDEETLAFDGLLGFGSSFFFTSSVFWGDFGAGVVLVVAGVSEVEDSESELLEPDPELVEVLPLLLESEEDPELLSVLLLLTSKFVILVIGFYKLKGSRHSLGTSAIPPMQQLT